MRFTKMQGAGNDYIYVDCTREVPEDLPGLAVRLSKPHFGVGSDGLICLLPSGKADFRMRMFNADGSEGTMCGNGLRCLCKFAYDKGLTPKTDLTVETMAGVRTCVLHMEAGRVIAVRVDMGVPLFRPSLTLTVAGQVYEVTSVSMGNPHAVVFSDGVDELDLTTLGSEFEHHPAFAPQRVNAEFVEVLSPTRLKLRVWERGSGETLACGTGACAALAAAASIGRCGRRATVVLPGGELELGWSENDGHITMTGNAVTVFEGEIYL